MNKELARVYENRIDNYRTLPWLKDLILTASKKYPMRPDATLFLIVNFDELIVSPTAALLGSPIQDPFQYQPNLDSLRPPVQRALEIVFSDLTEVNEISAHQIMRAIDRNWKPLTEIFGWG